MFSRYPSLRLPALIGLVLVNLAFVFGKFFIDTKAPGYVAAFHGITPGVVVAFLVNWLCCQMAVSDGGYNLLKLEVTVVAVILAAAILGVDIYIVRNFML